MISIRPETPHDLDAIRHVTRQAFAASDFGCNGEAELIDLLRDGCEKSLSLVACANDAIVGHILFTPVVIRGRSEFHGMGLGPMSVAIDFQNTGIGSLLITSGLEQLKNDGCPFVVVLGHPEYYPRFGFLPASQFDVSHGFAGIPQNVFFLNILDSATTPSNVSGAAYYRPEFGLQPEDAE